MFDRHQGKPITTRIIGNREIVERPKPISHTSSLNYLAYFSVCCLVAALLFFLFQANAYMSRMESRQVMIGESSRLKAIDQQMEALRSKFNGLLAESVETRLRLLQKNIDSGKVGSEDLRAFGELQRDIELLENYSGHDLPLHNPTLLEHPRFQPVVSSANAGGAAHDGLIIELEQLRQLLFICLSILLFIILALGFVAWSRRRRASSLASLSYTPVSGKLLVSLKKENE